MDAPCYVPVSIGELIDKYTILRIKESKCVQPEQHAMVTKERSYLMPLVEAARVDVVLMTALQRVNGQLWEVEDQLRNKERLQSFDDAFIQLARSVYILNDERAAIKRAINAQSNSCLTEVKLYAPYRV